MKKLLALILTLCLLAVAIPVLAEGDAASEPKADESGALMNLLASLANADDENEEGEGDADGEGGMGALLGMLGSLTGNDEADDAGEGGMGALLGMVGGLLGGSKDGEAPAEPTYTAVVATSIDQFYGAWDFSRAFINGVELSPTMMALLGTTASAKLTIEDNKMTMDAALGDLQKSYAVDSTEESRYVIGMALSDGALNVTMEGETFVFQLTDAGELVLDVGDGIAMFFTPAE